VHKHLPILSLGFFNEGNSIIKDTFNIFSYVVLQVIAFISDTFVLKIVCTIIRSTVYYMSYSHFPKDFCILCHIVTSQIKEILNNF